MLIARRQDSLEGAIQTKKLWITVTREEFISNGVQGFVEGQCPPVFKITVRLLSRLFRRLQRLVPHSSDDKLQFVICKLPHSCYSLSLPRRFKQYCSQRGDKSISKFMPSPKTFASKSCVSQRAPIFVCVVRILLRIRDRTQRLLQNASNGCFQCRVRKFLCFSHLRSPRFFLP